MTYKNILVQIDTAASRSRYDVAAELAARADGHLTGLYLKTTLINQHNAIGSIGYLPPDDLDWMIKEHNQGQDEDAAKAAGMLARVAAVANAHYDWRTIGGDYPGDLISEVLTADLIVLPPPSRSPAYNVHASAVDIVLAGAPVLIAPPKVTKPLIGARALVAWNGSREAARAVRDALPLLTPGATVEVRIARPKEGAYDDGTRLRHHLERQGHTVHLVVAEEQGHAIGEWLRAEAAAADCDLMIMGLYGHTRLREFVLGGVSRDMLHHPSLPLLISH